MQPNTDTIKEITEGFFSKTQFPVNDLSVSFDEASNTFWCAVDTNDSRFLIGRSGENLQAINHLIRRIVSKILTGNVDEKPTYNILVDVNGYQRKRVDNLKATAHMLAERARFFKSNIEAEPMSSFERRIMHEHLSQEKDVETQSTGEGMNRRIVISYTGN